MRRGGAPQGRNHYKLSRNRVDRLARWPALIPLACVALAVLRRLPAWDPPSLWLDDLWMALALRYGGGLAELRALQLPSPIGFLVLEKLALGVSNDPEWPLQIVPAVCGLLVIPVFYWAMTKLVKQPLAIGLACLFAAFHPAAELYAMRVKHYSLDLLVVSGLCGLMFDALQTPVSEGNRVAPPQRSVARFLVLAAVSLACAPFSFASLFVSLCFVHALLFERALLGLRARRIDAALACAFAATCVFDVGVFLVHQEFLASQAGPTMKWFWRTYFLHFDSVRAVLLWIARRSLAWPMYALSWPLLPLLPLTYLGLRSAARDPQLRPLAVSFGALVVGLCVAAALDIYPMGAERTGQFSYPLFWAFTALGAERFVSARMGASAPAAPSRRSRQLTLALTAYVVLVSVTRLPVRYDDALDREVVDEALRQHRDGDGLLMQHTGLLAFSYYGGKPLRFEHYEDVCHRFAAIPDWPDLEVLPIAVGGTTLRDDPSVADGLLGAYYARGYSRIEYISTHATEHIDAHIVARAEKSGYHVQRIDKSPRARLFLFEKPGVLVRAH